MTSSAQLKILEDQFNEKVKELSNGLDKLQIAKLSTCDDATRSCEIRNAHDKVQDILNQSSKLFALISPHYK
jgi:hypothetical protein